MKRQRVLSQMKGQSKTPEKQPTKVVDRQPSRKRIQNNDSGDDLGSQGKNGGKDWEGARNVYQRPRKNKDEQCTGRNQ